MGMKLFAKNEMSKLPSGTASCFSGNRGSCYKHSGQAAGRVLPSWQGTGKDGGAIGAPHGALHQHPSECTANCCSLLPGLGCCSCLWMLIQSNCSDTQVCLGIQGAEIEGDLHAWDSTKWQTGENWESFADGNRWVHWAPYPLGTFKMNVKIRLALFDVLNTNHFELPCQQKVIFPSYLYFIRKGENSLPLVFWTVV